MAKIVSSKKQLRRLTEFMNENPEIANNLLPKNVAQKKWAEIAKELNSMGPPMRAADKWKRVWGDIKYKHKKEKGSNEKVVRKSSKKKKSTEPEPKTSIESYEIESDSVCPVDVKFEAEDAEADSIIEEDKMSDVDNINVTENNSQFKKVIENDLFQEDPELAIDRESIKAPANELFEHIKDTLGDIKTSLREIEDYSRKIYHLKRDKYEKILKLKKEKYEKDFRLKREKLEIQKQLLRYKENKARENNKR